MSSLSGRDAWEAAYADGYDAALDGEGKDAIYNCSQDGQEQAWEEGYDAGLQERFNRIFS